jgi:hypothetical protein
MRAPSAARSRRDLVGYVLGSTWQSASSAIDSITATTDVTRHAEPSASADYVARLDGAGNVGEAEVAAVPR